MLPPVRAPSAPLSSITRGRRLASVSRRAIGAPTDPRPPLATSPRPRSRPTSPRPRSRAPSSAPPGGTREPWASSATRRGTPWWTARPRSRPSVRLRRAPRKPRRPARRDRARPRRAVARDARLLAPRLPPPRRRPPPVPPGPSSPIEQTLPLWPRAAGTARDPRLHTRHSRHSPSSVFSPPPIRVSVPPPPSVPRLSG